MKRLAVLLLCAVMIVPLCFFGCGDGDDDTTVAAVTAAEEQRAELDLPEVTFAADYTFDIIGKASAGWNAEEMLCPEEDGDDVLVSAKYARYKAVEDMYGIKINTTLKENITTIVSGSISSNDKSFDMIWMDTADTSSAAMGDLLLNLYDVEALNLEAPWYDANYTKDMTIGDVLYSSVNDMETIDMHCTWIMMYNKRLIDQYQLKDPYDMVKDNEWTFDNFTAMLTGISKDNGDGIWDKEDTYAFATHAGAARNFFFGAGMRICDKNEANYPELVVQNNKNVVKLQEKVVNLLHNDNTTHFTTDGSIISMFMGGRALFLAEITGYVGAFAEMDDDYGIVPYPKYDEKQKRYYTTNDPCIMVMSLPAFSWTEQELDQIGTVTETLCWESYYTLRPAYYEKTLGGKGTRDEGSYEMLNLCRESRVYDFGLFNPSISLHNAFSALIQDTDTSYASFIKRKAKAAQQELQDIIDKYEKA